MKILPTVAFVVKGLRQEQAPKLIQSIAKQSGIEINPKTLKTGIFENHLVGIDDAGRFIATQGSKLPNGNFATMSRYGYLESGCYSKIISETGAKTERGFFSELVSKLGLNFNMGRTKTGLVNGKPIAIEYDTGRFVTATKEQLTKEGWATTGQIGKIEGVISKEVPKEDLLAFNIIKRNS